MPSIVKSGVPATFLISFARVIRKEEKWSQMACLDGARMTNLTVNEWQVLVVGNGIVQKS